MCVCVCVCVWVCVCVCVCVGSIMFLHVRVCVHVCVGSMCVFVCACPETVSAVLEFTFVVIVITIISHVWMCVFVTVYTCV